MCCRGQASDPFWANIGISERTLLTALAVRAPALAAAGRLPHVLQALTAWQAPASAAGLSQAEGLRQYGEITDFLSTLHCAYRSVLS